MSFNFRALKSTDHESVILFITEINQSHQSQGFSWNELNLKSEFVQSKCFVLEKQTQIIAFLSVRDLSDSSEVTCLAVHHNYWGQGLAVQLMQEYIKIMKISKNNTVSRKFQIWLEVHEKNQRALRFYTQFGFKVVGVRKNYYPDGGEAKLMSYSF